MGLSTKQILDYLVMDEKELCQTAFDRGSLSKLSELVHALTPPPPTENKVPPELEEDEPESLCCLREAALTTIAVLALTDNDIRRDVTDGQRLLPPLASALTHRHTGVRYAACQCVRALSRSVAVTRASLVDSGLGTALFAVFAKEDEDRRVVHATLAAVCSLVNQYSPLRTPFLKQSIASRLSRLLSSPSAELRLSALWALKNLVYKCAPETKRAIMADVGWTALDARLDDADAGVREQALYLLRDFARTTTTRCSRPSVRRDCWGRLRARSNRATRTSFSKRRLRSRIWRTVTHSDSRSSSRTDSRSDLYEARSSMRAALHWERSSSSRGAQGSSAPLGSRARSSILSSPVVVVAGAALVVQAPRRLALVGAWIGR